MFFIHVFLRFQVKSDLLHVRIPIPRFPHPRYNLFGDDDSPLLFPSLCRGKGSFDHSFRLLEELKTLNISYFCPQDYHWWWRSFMTSGFTAFYLLIYCVHYFFDKLNIEDGTSTFLYFGYTLIMVFLFFLLTGESVA